MYGTRSQQPAGTPDQGPYAAALRAVVADCMAARKCSQRDKALILELGARAPADVRDECFRRLGDLLKTASNRGSETYENVIAFLDRMKKSEWTAVELRRGLANDGVKVSAKRLSDVTNYLVRAGRFKRLWRGHYQDAMGNVFVTSDELPLFAAARDADDED